ncbi:MAG: type II toxin-antitoxin system Phd/YefM family antitoxin [Acidobacteriota bacterium]
MKFLNITTARNELLKLVDAGLGERITVTKGGQPKAVLMSIDDYRALRATEALAADPAQLAELRAMVKRVRAGGMKDFPEAGAKPRPRTAAAAKASAG